MHLIGTQFDSNVKDVSRGRSSKSPHVVQLMILVVEIRPKTIILHKAFSIV